MSALTLLRTLFNYQAWANEELLQKMEGFDPVLHPQERLAALRLLNHCRVVNQIFAAQLVGAEHGFTADNTPDTPTLEALGAALTESDRWFLAYLETVTPEQLSERLTFVFTDGDQGCMTREEMLTHVVTHNGYHRGEVGRLLASRSLSLPWDTFAVFLHQKEPERRVQAREPFTAPLR